MNIERALIDRIGDVGRKLHTGRSRNDQVSTDLRLWVRDEIDAMSARLRELQRAFVGRAERDAGVILPGYTHLQRAQPVLAAHYWLAYCEKFERDRERLADCRRRVNQLPLGHGRPGRHHDPHRPPHGRRRARIRRHRWPTASTPPATATSCWNSPSAWR